MIISLSHSHTPWECWGRLWSQIRRAKAPPVRWGWRRSPPWFWRLRPAECPSRPAARTRAAFAPPACPSTGSFWCRTPRTAPDPCESSNVQIVKAVFYVNRPRDFFYINGIIIFCKRSAAVIIVNNLRHFKFTARPLNWLGSFISCKTHFSNNTRLEVWISHAKKVDFLTLFWDKLKICVGELYYLLMKSTLRSRDLICSFQADTCSWNVSQTCARSCRKFPF